MYFHVCVYLRACVCVYINQAAKCFLFVKESCDLIGRVLYIVTVLLGECFIKVVVQSKYFNCVFLTEKQLRSAC